MNPFVSNGNTLKWMFENVKDLDENGKDSEEFKIGPTKWKINVLTYMENDVKYLSVYLYYVENDVIDKNWICQTDRTITLVNQNENGIDVSKNTSISYSNNFNDWGWSQFYKWDDLLKYGYMKYDLIIIEVDLSFKYYDFSKNVLNLTDTILKVKDTEFYTNKGILCMKSEYFYDLFIKQNYNENVVEIKDVELDDFRFFLASFYPFFESIQKKNYSKLIELADKYKVSTLHKNCENYLLKDVKICVEKKFEYADKYDYNDLMKQCIKTLDTIQKIKNIRKSDEFYKFKESTKHLIMTKVLDFV
ncbi:unnamed protein product [Caenorhabditis angaria]|uniref:BTB domain-containing protein n=1 Tax=Caenorhabditis angaria TaxID=860376 RepID=A0A9P1I907_9PELO|nr:unnamed protein product [Caenorhabditis angaria]